ncbi:hypothetical protein BDZ45DRAFT_366975 [Acephala macrosclerotiorum]|nr:hypothetical protein BDZ45DRAFT_366975 [Acephala macrosclerotiorum]
MVRARWSKNFYDQEAQRRHNVAKQLVLASSAMGRMVSFRSWYQLTKDRRDKERTLFTYLLQTATTDKPSEKLHASDERDRIFALLGLATDHDQLKIPIDYESSKAADVFVNASKAMLSTLDLTILALRARPSSSMANLPSCVGDWTANVSLPFGDNSYIDRPFPVCGISTARLSFPSYPGENIFCINGICVGTVSKVGFAPYLDSTMSPEDVKLIGDVFVSSAEIFFAPHTQEDIACTLIRDYEAFTQDTGVRMLRCATSRSLHNYHEMKRWFALGREKREINEETKLGYTPERAQHLDEFSHRFSSFLTSNGTRDYCTVLGNSLLMRPFVLCEGYIGLGPLKMEAGDTVCIFLGEHLSFVLRPENHYRLLGDAYVHEVMDGQLMNTNPDAFLIYRSLLVLA